MGWVSWGPWLCLLSRGEDAELEGGMEICLTREVSTAWEGGLNVGEVRFLEGLSVTIFSEADIMGRVRSKKVEDVEGVEFAWEGKDNAILTRKGQGYI